jgi:hypothetical protein
MNENIIESHLKGRQILRNKYSFIHTIRSLKTFIISFDENNLKININKTLI